MRSTTKRKAPCQAAFRLNEKNFPARIFGWDFFVLFLKSVVVYGIIKKTGGVSVVKHIILWKLKSEHNNDAVKRGIKENLEGLLGVIDGLVEISVQTDTLDSSNADVMLYSVFTDEAALKNYAVHPEHVKVADTYVSPFTETRSCIDFEV